MMFESDDEIMAEVRRMTGAVAAMFSSVKAACTREVVLQNAIDQTMLPPATPIAPMRIIAPRYNMMARGIYETPQECLAYFQGYCESISLQIESKAQYVVVRGMPECAAQKDFESDKLIWKIYCRAHFYDDVVEVKVTKNDV